jgi:predicted DNA-binding protein
MTSKVVSIRLPESELQSIDELATKMAIERATIIRRLISVGVQGLSEYEASADSADWPREGRMQLKVIDV